MDATCLRKVSNWSYITKDHKFDKKTFNPVELLNNIEKFSPKVVALLKNIQELDENDMKTHGKHFKHFIFSEVKHGGYGVKVITSAMIAAGFHLGYDNKIKLLSDNDLLKNKGNNILLLSSTTIFNNTINVKAKKSILSKYNQRPENVHGDLARFILLDSGFKEGIDLFDVKYVHIFEPQTSKADQKQAIGRATRLCGQKGLEFHPKYGWPLEIFMYDVSLPQYLSEQYDAQTMYKLFLNHSGIDLRKIEFADELEKYSIVGAVDYELTKNVHRFKIEDDDINLEWMFPSQGGAKKSKPTDVMCDKKCSTRPTKDVPVSLPLFTAISFATKHKLPDLRKTKPRAYFCQLLKTDTNFCATCKEAWKDPVKYVQKNKDNILSSIENREHLKMPWKNRPAIFKFIYNIIPRPQKTKNEQNVKVDKQLTPKTHTESIQPLSPSDILINDTSAPNKLMNFLEMREHIRDNYIQYTWPKVKLENLCVPKGGSELVKFTPTQDFIRNFFTPESAYKGMLLWHSVGTGKCWKENTPILMFDGTIKMVQDVRVGDIVMGDDSTPRSVLSLGSGHDDMYDIISTKGDKYTVNSEHILVLQYTGTPESYLQKYMHKDRTVEIEVRDYLTLPKSIQKELKGIRTGVHFPNQIIDFDPYIIGLWLGDGNARCPTISTQDSEIIVYLKNTLAKYDLMLYYESNCDYHIVPIVGKHKNKFLQVLQKYNLLNNKHIPHCYKCNDEKTRLQVLAGILDIDGSYSKKDQCFYIPQKSDKLTEDILYLVRSLGFAAWTTHKSEINEHMYNCVTISGDGLDRIPTRLNHKKAFVKKQIKDQLLTDIDVQHVGKGKYYGFTLNGNNRLLMGDFTVTHNTCCAIATATSSFEKEGYTILWVTRTTLKSDIFKNMFDQVCHIVLQEKMANGFKIPEASTDRLRLLSSSWKIRPMSYKQFSNLVTGKNSLYQDLVAINGKEDPLKKTLLIIDEAHKLYGGTDLSSTERPDMVRLHKAIMNSYTVSGKDSVRLLMMTATPITNDPMELVKLLNLCRESEFQLAHEYDKFAEEFAVDNTGKFTKKGSRKFLDTVAGYISYLSREKDARQFSQPLITNVNVPLSLSDSSVFDDVSSNFQDQIIEKKNEVDSLVGVMKLLKAEITTQKKVAKTDCIGLKKGAKEECMQTAQKKIDELNESLFSIKTKLDNQKEKLKQEISQIKKAYNNVLKKTQDDKSQQGMIKSKCIKKDKKKTSILDHINSPVPVPSSSKSDSEDIQYTPKN